MSPRRHGCSTGRTGSTAPSPRAVHVADGSVRPRRISSSTHAWRFPVHGFCVDYASIGPLVPEASGGHGFDPGDCAAWVRAGAAPVVRSELFGLVQLTHVNLNDMTVEGLRTLELSAFSVQYHPEAAPGPHDARYLFEAFARLMDGDDDLYAIRDGE